MADARGKKYADYQLKQRRSLEEKAKNEPDPDWRRFFLQVARKQKALTNPAARPVVRCDFEKDGRTQTVQRIATDPQALKNFLKVETKKAGPKLADDLEWLRSAWPHLVDAEVAGDTDVFAFKNGVLTIVVYNNVLLQEIRPFHQDTIFQDLRDIWKASMPLVDIVYRIGIRKG